MNMHEWMNETLLWRAYIAVKNGCGTFPFDFVCLCDVFSKLHVLHIHTLITVCSCSTITVICFLNTKQLLLVSSNEPTAAHWQLRRGRRVKLAAIYNVTTGCRRFFLKISQHYTLDLYGAIQAPSTKEIYWLALTDGELQKRVECGTWRCWTQKNRFCKHVRYAHK